MTSRLFLALCLAASSAFAGMDHSSSPPDLRAFATADTPGGIAPGALVPNFRLTDHRGVTHELYYESAAKAIVLVFTGTGNSRSLQTAATLRALRARFSANDVVIWQIDSNAGVSRTAINAEQTLFNNDTPVLLDDAQVVANELGVTRQLEALVIAAPSTLVYRGPLDNAAPDDFSAPTENYVADAVTALLANRAVAKSRVEMFAASARIDLLPTTGINYATDVAPIVLRRCVSCHSNGNIAPHVYAAFDDLASRATAVRADMLAQRMSPWHADPQYGVFGNTLGLTPAERATLHAWTKAGAPRGTGADPLVTAPAPPGGDWPLGQPDLIVTIPKQSIPARGVVDYRYITVTVPTPTDRPLRAAIIKPGNRAVVHHGLAFEGSQLDLLAAALGGNVPGLGGFFAAYVPGLQQTFYPEGTGKMLKQNGQLTFQMHYTTTGQAETDETQIGFYYASAPPARILLSQAAVNTSLKIPPGSREYEQEATAVLSTTKDTMLYELEPHMHLRGKRFKFEALYPDGTSEVLLNVPQYDFAWQSQYRLSEPKRLPAGTSIRVRAAFDNSAQNAANPDPTATVTFGDQTFDEMLIGYVTYTELPARATAAAPVFSDNVVARGRVGEPMNVTLRANATGVTYRASGLPAGLKLDASSGAISGTASAAGRYAIAVTAENTAGTAASTIDLLITPPEGAPVFTTQPRSVRAHLGETVTLVAAVSAAPTPTYTWYFRGGEFCNTESPVLALTDITAAYAGDYYCVAANSAGTATSATATLTLEFSGLVNLSARANVGTGANVVIPGISISGTKSKTLLIRAVGPALAAAPFNVSGTLSNPTLSVFTAAGEKVLVNDDWGDVPDVAALRAAALAQGAFPLPDGSRDAAMLVTLPPGSYTVQVAGNGTGAAAQGVAIVEVYEADANPSTLVNLSCRARVGTGADILIAGFTISGTESKRVLIRGVGPTLGNLGVAGALADPKLDLIQQNNGATIASNDNWDASIASIFGNVGAFALTAGSRDAAMIVTLQPGSYTAQVSGVGNTTGVAIVEVYELP